MTTFAGTIIPWILQQFTDEDGNPLVGAQLFSYTAGSNSPLPTYTDTDLNSENPNPIIMGADGRPESGAIYLAPAAYKFVLKDADDVTLWTRDNVEDVGATFAGNFGLVQYQGSKSVTSGYSVLNTDRTITVDSDGGADPCVINLISAALSQQMLTIKNMGAIEIALTPNGTETIDGVAGVFTIPVAASPIFPSVVLIPNGSSDWLLIASHGL